MKKIICFGDTITEMGAVIELRGYVAQLMDRFARRADVLLRGFAGYTTREALKILPAILEEKPYITIVFFGVSDSALPGQIQHVPVDEFRDNLTQIVQQLGVNGVWVILVTPPPVDDRLVKSHSLSHTSKYAEACCKVAEEMQVPVVNLFERVLQEPNWQKTCLMEGLHLSARGMDILYNELVPILDRIRPLDRYPRLAVGGY